MTSVQDPGGRERSATVYDVAELAGVSAQTVSRLIKGYQGIRPGTRERVEAAIAQLDYRPNLAARQLRTRKSTRIGAVVSGMFEYGPAVLLRGAAQAARDSGYSLNIVGVGGDDESAIRDAFEAFEDEKVAGILAITLTDGVRAVVEKRMPDVPILIDPADAHLDGPSMNEAGAALVARHFVNLGHRRVGMLMGAENWLPARQRRDGFLSELNGTGVECVRIWAGDWTAAAGVRVGEELDSADGITAIFAPNDLGAIGVIHGLQERGLSVPDDVSVAGFDATPQSGYLRPSLTTVEADYETRGRNAILGLLAQIDGTTDPQFEAATVSLLARQSTAAPAR